MTGSISVKIDFHVSTIRLLPEHIANQIAAGEVVEGPSSIIKELVENSIDAGATKIDISISKNFLQIQVIDNGSGMSLEDLELAFKKHATSKIKSIEDIYSLITNGFRGEALPSIAAVSKLTCISKREEDEHAHKIYLENGKQELKQTGASKGTNVLVDELFFNTPARLKFLKSNTRERNFIIDISRALAFAHPEIAISLSIDSRTIFKTLGSTSLEMAIKEIFKDDLSKSLCPVKLERGDVKVSGYTTNAHTSRSDKRGIFTILNGRALQCYIIRSAIEAVYKEILGSGKYPISVIRIDLPSDQVDVNVHPNKKEVKYANTNTIYTAVGDAVSKALADNLYEKQKSFQPSLDEHYLRVQSQADQQSFNNALVGKSEKYTSTKSQAYDSDFSIVNSAKNEAAMEIIDSHFPEAKSGSFRSDFSFENNSDLLSSDSRKFISRFGSLDISVLDSLSLDTVMSSQGSKTSFEIVVKDEDINKSVLIRGDFIGENWLKEIYLEFLSKTGREILNREKLEINFKVKDRDSNRSRPASKPSLAKLEEIWRRDNYTCVYCHKLLLHPDTVKNSLKATKDPELLNSHVASYDHHLPASKYQALNKDQRNLYACCQECNIKKSDSLATKTWTPEPKDGWTKGKLEIGGQEFLYPVE